VDGLPEKRLIDGWLGSSLYDAVPANQFTLRQAIGCFGVGLHTGRRIALRLLPAPVGAGIVFRRVDVGVEIAARYDMVRDTRLCTVIGRDGIQVATIEHLMAALVGTGIDNVIVEVDGPEVPVLDGSADGFVFLLECAGRVEQEQPRQCIEILQPVRVDDGEGYAELRPTKRFSLDMAISIDFAAPAIGRQALSLTLSAPLFRSELMRARTFTHADEVEELHKAGLALGGGLHNAVVVDGAKVLNPEGLRMQDEFVRHKTLDMIGDLALAGHAINGRVIAHRPGHTLNNRLLHKLFADDSAWRLAPVEATEGWLSAA
jgi:UDP-3-O-[3-hydroxymyristoyl] N-acetylglucosamine deacetylase